MVICFFFFFQAEDGIRDGHVTGVQTCALPIWTCRWRMSAFGGEAYMARAMRNVRLCLKVQKDRGCANLSRFAIHAKRHGLLIDARLSYWRNRIIGVSDLSLALFPSDATPETRLWNEAENGNAECRASACCNSSGGCGRL